MMSDYEISQQLAVNTLTLRDWFAAQALAGLLPTYGREGGIDYACAAQWAYRQADALLAERAK